MFHDIIFLLLGLALIIAGGNILTDGAVAIAKKFKISPLVIGLTIVAFGSSTPDFVISFISTLTGKSELALGDIVGANIFDLLLVVGIVALISPINVAGDMARKDIPMLFLSSTALFLCAADKLVDHLPANIIDRTDGLLLLVFFAFFMQFTFSMAHRRSISPSSTAMTSPATYAGPPTSMPATTPGFPDKPKYAMWIAAIYVAGGLAALVFGGQWLVDGASGIAIKIGISEALVGLTIVGIGSSIPDLATSVIAAIKKTTRHSTRQCDRSVHFQCIFHHRSMCDRQTALRRQCHQHRLRHSCIRVTPFTDFRQHVTPSHHQAR